MIKRRVLAYTLSSIVQSEELDEVSWGSATQNFPTIVVTGSPIFPDTITDQSK